MIYRKIDLERIRRNYCIQSIRHMLIYRFSMAELRRIARRQGMPYIKDADWHDRHCDEFSWFERKIYDAMSESVRNSVVKYERRLFEPMNSISITEEDHSNWDEFEKTIYEIVK